MKAEIKTAIGMLERALEDDATLVYRRNAISSATGAMSRSVTWATDINAQLINPRAVEDAFSGAREVISKLTAYNSRPLSDACTEIKLAMNTFIDIINDCTALGVGLKSRMLRTIDNTQNLRSWALGA